MFIHQASDDSSESIATPFSPEMRSTFEDIESEVFLCQL